ncbi:MAG TPA: dTMP kinase [Bacteroidales bacterium]|nr:dTMP kinase [Bacteroidales bacterium]
MKFVVIEGLDGSGKSTQVGLLKEYLKKNNISFQYIHFPRVETGIYGDMVARFLRGEFGNNDQVNPYLVALLYAGDRMDAAGQINQWLANDELVLLDRYVISNIAYQCAKVVDKAEKEKLKNWILQLEYEHNKIPVPTINIFLDVPFDFTRERLTQGRTGDDRDYLNGATDIHEADLNFQEKVREVYLEFGKDGKALKIISCNENGKMLPPDIIFEKILNILKNENVL